MHPHQGICHTAGRYPEWLHHKGSKNNGKDKGGHQPFQSTGNLCYPVSVMLSLPSLFIGFNL
jgi:hypothetical protein